MIIRKIGLIGKTYRHVERYIEILGILFKYGFDDLLDKLRIEQYVDFGRKLLFRQKHAKLGSLSRAQRLRMALEELGPTFIKFGQMLSTRTDLLPPDFIGELVKLRDEVPPVPYEQAEKVLHAELGDNLSEIFEPIDPKPAAAARVAGMEKRTLKTSTTR